MLKATFLRCDVRGTESKALGKIWAITLRGRGRFLSGGGVSSYYGNKKKETFGIKGKA